jgi:hypothetical protein
MFKSEGLLGGSPFFYLAERTSNIGIEQKWQNHSNMLFGACSLWIGPLFERTPVAENLNHFL